MLSQLSDVGHSRHHRLPESQSQERFGGSEIYVINITTEATAYTSENTAPATMPATVPAYSYAIYHASYHVSYLIGYRTSCLTSYLSFHIEEGKEEEVYGQDG